MTNINSVNWFGTKSHTKRSVHLTILGTSDVLTLPVEVTTKVHEVRGVLSARLGLDADDFEFIVKQCSSTRRLRDCDEIRSCMVKGVKSWSRAKAKYPHPIGIIGAGHQGLRQALSFKKEDVLDFVIFDRLDKVGGVAWVTNANPTSKLQTELAVYHLDYDDLNPVPCDSMPTWPTRDELLSHFEDVCVEYGIVPHLQLNADVIGISTVEDDPAKRDYHPARRHFDFRIRRSSERALGKPSAEEREEEEAELRKVSAIACYPGALTSNIRKEWPGEDSFEGQIGYGMFMEFDYTVVAGSDPAVMGMGAFGVENVRTCLEHGANKVWLICRRKNLVCPRVMSWFANQSLFPPSCAMVLDAMTKMYDLTPDDPWDHYAVSCNKDRSIASIRQKARFGISDVYFLAVYYGKAEVLVDEIKRLTQKTIILESGRRISADHFIKVLGFHPDHSLDKLMGIKQMVGYFPNGDWRQWVVAESPGIDANKLGGTSLSPGIISTVEAYSYFINYPKDASSLLDHGLLPSQKANKEKNLPSYIWDLRSTFQINLVFSGGLFPFLAERGNVLGPLKRAKMLEAHPPQVFLKEAAAEWSDYCHKFQDPDDQRPHPAYPYTYEYVSELLQRNDREGQQQQMSMSGMMMAN